MKDSKDIIKLHNEALHGIGVKVARDFRFRCVSSIHSLSSGARPPRELRRYAQIK